MATYQPVYVPRVATRTRRGLYLVAFLLLLIPLGGALWWIARPHVTKQDPAKAVDTGGWPAWMHKSEVYAPPQVTPVSKPPEVNPLAGELDMVRQMLLDMQRDIDDLKRRPQTQPVEAKAPAVPPVKRKTPPMRMLEGKAPVAQAQASEPTYVIQPGSFVPCTIETAMNSDIGDSTFTALVTTTVYDTATGHYPLIPQYSKIVGKAEGSALLYGNEKMRTVSLTLARRTGPVIDLGEAPLTDQAGINGLASTVNQHYGRLLGAVLIGGALKGGVQAMQTGMMDAAGAGQVASGIASYGQQATGQLVGPALNTRPTIEVFAGQLCHVLLMKPLDLTVAH